MIILNRHRVALATALAASAVAIAGAPVAAQEPTDTAEVQIEVGYRDGDLVVERSDGSYSVPIDELTEQWGLDDRAPVGTFEIDGLALATAPGIHIVFHAEDNVPADVHDLALWAALQWELLLEPEGPVEIDFYWEDLPEGVLGAAGPTGFKQTPLLGTDAYVPAAVLNHQAGIDMFPGQTEALIVLNKDLYQAGQGWCTSLDRGQCFAHNYDLPNVLLHELGHALGHTDSARQSPGESPRFLSPPNLYDTKILYASQTSPGAPVTYIPLLETADPGSLVESGMLWMHSNESHQSVQQLYAPYPFESGSSLGHWDEGRYGENLMTPYSYPSDFAHRSLPAIHGDRMDVIGWGTLTDGRSNPPALSASCVNAVENTVAGSNGGEFESVVQSDPAAARIWRLYGVMFRRQPDAAGFAYWQGRYASGMTIEEMTDFFSQAPEVALVYSDGLRAEEYVASLYENAFGRCPDDAGKDFWINQLYTGGLSRGEVLNNFAESKEFGLRTGVGLTNYGDGDITN